MDDRQAELELIATARDAISSCNWVVGECAAQWTARYAKGRTDADFGALVGLTGDQVCQRRRVWEVWADVRDTYANLKWSHFYVAVPWDEATECLTWANDNSATVAEMKAWRRMQNGEDLTIDPIEDRFTWNDPGSGDPVVRTAGHEPEPGPEPQSPAATFAALAHDDDEQITQVDPPSQQSEQPYAPFRAGAMTVPDDKPQPVRLEPEQAVKRVTAAIERSGRMLVNIQPADINELPEKLRIRMQHALQKLIDQCHANGLAREHEAAA